MQYEKNSGFTIQGNKPQSSASPSPQKQEEQEAPGWAYFRRMKEG